MVGDSTPSIRGLARATDVSASTVSRAFAIPGLVRHDTLEPVLAVAGEFGYHPDRAVRGLATGKSGNIGVIAPDSDLTLAADMSPAIATTT